MNALMPTWVDLEHTAVWVIAVLAVAVILGGVWALIDQLYRYGWPEHDASTDDAPPVRVTVRIARPFSEPAPKGWKRIDTVVDLEDRRRQLAAAATLPCGRRTIH